MCGYDITQNPVPTCPECGYCLTREDIQLNTKRVACLELTKHSAIRRHVLCTIALVFVIPYVGVFIALPPILSVFLLPQFQMKGTKGKLRRRVWLMASVWLQVPWVIVGSAGLVYEFLFWKTYRMYSLGLPDSLSDYPTPLLISAATAVFALSALLWRRSVRRLALVTGITDDDQILRWKLAATRVAVIAYLIPLIGVLFAGLVWIVDTIWPGWG